MRLPCIWGRLFGDKYENDYSRPIKKTKIDTEKQEQEFRINARLKFGEALEKVKGIVIKQVQTLGDQAQKSLKDEVAARNKRISDFKGQLNSIQSTEQERDTTQQMLQSLTNALNNISNLD